MGFPSFALTVVVLVTVILLALGGIIKRQVDTRGSDWAIFHSELSNSAWPSVNPTVLLAFRTTVFLFCFGVIVYQFILEKNIGDTVRYYTWWNFCLLTTYFGCMSGFGFYVMKKPGCLTERLGVFGCFCLSSYQVCLTTVFLVDVVLWAVLYPAGTPTDRLGLVKFPSLIEHGLNLVFMGVELSLNRLPVIGAHVCILTLWPCAWCIFQWVYHAKGGEYLYFFMDTSKAIAPLWYLGMLMGHWLFFGFVYYLSRCKFRRIRTKHPNRPEPGRYGGVRSLNSSLHSSALSFKDQLLISDDDDESDEFTRHHTPKPTGI